MQHNTEIRTLQRDHIISTLTAAVNAHSLVVLTAPMGYGKTMAARELTRSINLRSFFVTVDPGPHPASYTWGRAAEQLAAQGAGSADVLRRARFPGDIIQLRRIFDRVRGYLAAEPTLLVVDDYHYAENPEMERIIAALTRECIPGLHILLVSRNRPRFPLEEFRIKGQAAYFDARLFSFSAKEAVDFFALHGITDSETALQAWRYSEGWPAALWLSLNSCLAGDTASPSKDMDYLLTNMFASYDLEDKALLLQLSILDSFTPLQAARVSGRDDAPRRLRLLHEQNALMAYDPGTDSYRLHSLFLSMLRGRMSDQDHPLRSMIDCAALHRRAGEWFAREGDLVKAIRHYFTAGTDEDYYHILCLLEKSWEDVSILSDPEGIARIMDAIPWRVRRRCPIGYLAFIHQYMSRVNREKGFQLIRAVEERCRKDRNMSVSLRRRIQGEVELISQLVDFNDIYAMRDRNVRAYRLLEGRSAISHRSMVWTFGCPHQSYLYLREPGTYEDIVRLVEQDAVYFQELTEGCGAGFQDLVRGEYLMETGDLKGSEPHLMKAVYLGGSKRQRATLVAACFAQARLSMARGEGIADMDSLNELASVVALEGNPILSTSLDLAFGYINAVRNNIEGIPEWLRKGEIDAGPNFYQARGYVMVVHSKAMVANGEWAKLDAQVHADMGELKFYHNLFGYIHVNTLRAIAAHGLGRHKEAVEHFMRAVRLAEGDGILLSIAEYGTALMPVLESAMTQQEHGDFLHRLRELTGHYVAGPRDPWKLTRRERELLELVAEGKKNEDIALLLGVKPVTVGNTLTRVYRKMGAQNRTEAAKRWRAEQGK